MANSTLRSSNDAKARSPRDPEQDLYAQYPDVELPIGGDRYGVNPIMAQGSSMPTSLMDAFAGASPYSSAAAGKALGNILDFQQMTNAGIDPGLAGTEATQKEIQQALMLMPPVKEVDSLEAIRPESPNPDFLMDLFRAFAERPAVNLESRPMGYPIPFQQPNFYPISMPQQPQQQQQPPPRPADDKHQTQEQSFQLILDGKDDPEYSYHQGDSSYHQGRQDYTNNQYNWNQGYPVPIPPPEEKTYTPPPEDSYGGDGSMVGPGKSGDATANVGDININVPGSNPGSPGSNQGQPWPDWMDWMRWPYKTTPGSGQRPATSPAMGATEAPQLPKEGDIAEDDAWIEVTEGDAKLMGLPPTHRFYNTRTGESQVPNPRPGWFRDVPRRMGEEGGLPNIPGQGNVNVSPQRGYGADEDKL